MGKLKKKLMGLLGAVLSMGSLVSSSGLASANKGVAVQKFVDSNENMSLDQATKEIFKDENEGPYDYWDLTETGGIEKGKQEDVKIALNTWATQHHGAFVLPNSGLVVGGDGTALTFGDLNSNNVLVRTNWAERNVGAKSSIGMKLGMKFWETRYALTLSNSSWTEKGKTITLPVHPLCDPYAPKDLQITNDNRLKDTSGRVWTIKNGKLIETNTESEAVQISENVFSGLKKENNKPGSTKQVEHKIILKEQIKNNEDVHNPKIETGDKLHPETTNENNNEKEILTSEKKTENQGNINDNNETTEELFTPKNEENKKDDDQPKKQTENDKKNSRAKKIGGITAGLAAAAGVGYGGKKFLGKKRARNGNENVAEIKKSENKKEESSTAY